MEYLKLRGLIREKGKTEADLAKALNLSPSSLSCRLNGKTDWSLSEIQDVCTVLNIAEEEIPKYFFRR